jgi:redox-sensing transcriptional repressor
MEESKVPLPTLERLATYLRYLNESTNRDEVTISSARMEEATGIHAAQFRKDLSYFGEFGQPGIGYKADELRQRIAAILKVEDTQPVILIGAGNLGSALLGYAGLPQHNFPIVGVFDNNANKIGYKLWNRTIEDIADLKAINRELKSQIAIVCVPNAAAQKVADQLVDAGIRVILNFAPTVLRVPERVFVRNVCFVQELMVLSFFLSPGLQAGD